MVSTTAANKTKIKAAYISFTIGVLLFFGKIFAYYLTDSKAIFSDAAESVVHVMATLMALYSIILSAKPPDKSHLYGHGNIEYFSAGIEGLLIVLAAVTIIYTAVDSLIIGSHLAQLDVGVFIIAAAGVINIYLGLFLLRQGKSTNSLALIADGKHVLTDSYTSIGVVAGLILVMITDYDFLDPIVAIIVALNIIYTGYKLVRDSIGGLMNETDKKLLDDICNKLIEKKEDYWIDIHQLRFWTSADKVFIDFHLCLPYYFNIRESHDEEVEIDKHLTKLIPNCQIKIHMDYCYDELCSYCDFSKCEVRKKEKSINVNWDQSKLIGLPVHQRSDIHDHEDEEIKGVSQ